MNVSFLLVAAIFLISWLLTMVGLGGGLIFSPLFVILGMAKTAAAPASLFLNLVAAGSAAYTYARKGMVDFSLSVPLIVSSGLTAPVGSYLNMQIALEPFLMTLAVVLALAGIRMTWSPTYRSEAEAMPQWKKIVAGLGIGACIGLVGGMLGIGGGVFIVPLLIYVLKTPTKIAAASSTFIVCFSSLTGFLGYAGMEALNWWFILPAAAASLAGGQAGSRVMSTRLKGKSIRVIFSIVLFVMCAKLIHQYFS